MEFKLHDLNLTFKLKHCTPLRLCYPWQDNPSIASHQIHAQKHSQNTPEMHLNIHDPIILGILNCWSFLLMTIQRRIGILLSLVIVSFLENWISSLSKIYDCIFGFISNVLNHTILRSHEKALLNNFLSL